MQTNLEKSVETVNAIVERRKPNALVQIAWGQFIANYNKQITDLERIQIMTREDALEATECFAEHLQEIVKRAREEIAEQEAKNQDFA